VIHHTEKYIDVPYPKLSYDENKNIKCDYYIQPDYFIVEIGGAKSNKYFYYKDDINKIVTATIPICSNNSCSMKVYFSKPIFA
jgi:hypothetical protein